MRALSGCTRCGHVERSYGKDGGGRASRGCPECGFPMKEVDLLAARLLARDRRTAKAARVQRQDTLVERALKTSRRLRRAETLRAP
jgi:hypothetical protein